MMKWETAIKQILWTNQTKKQMIHKTTTKHELTKNSGFNTEGPWQLWKFQTLQTKLGDDYQYLFWVLIIYHLFVQDLWWPPSSRASLQTTCRTTSSKCSGAQLVALLVLFISYTQFLTFILSHSGSPWAGAQHRINVLWKLQTSKLQTSLVNKICDSRQS